MPIVPFTTLPDSARVWVFASAKPLDAAAEQLLLYEVDAYLEQWKAHGSPLTASREWQEHRFLTIAVDTSDTAASGCSIDGLFRVLQQLSTQLGTSLVGSGRIYYRDAAGEVVCVGRSAFGDLAQRREITRDVMVFDMTVPTLGEWRQRFETPASGAWHGALMPVSG